MKKYEIAEVIGSILFMVDIGLALLLGSMDIDRTPNPTLVAIIGWSIILVVAGAGLTCYYLSKVEGIFFACLIAICARLYKIFKRKGSFCHYCYKLKKQYKDTSTNSFVKCIDTYESYVDKIYVHRRLH